jgi:hypothetical protein
MTHKRNFTCVLRTSRRLAQDGVDCFNQGMKQAEKQTFKEESQGILGR